MLTSNCFVTAAVLLLSTSSRMLIVAVATLCSAPIIAMTMSDRIGPYLMAVAPDWSSTMLFKDVGIIAEPSISCVPTGSRIGSNR